MSCEIPFPNGSITYPEVEDGPSNPLYLKIFTNFKELVSVFTFCAFLRNVMGAKDSIWPMCFSGLGVCFYIVFFWCEVKEKKKVALKKKTRKEAQRMMEIRIAELLLLIQPPPPPPPPADVQPPPPSVHQQATLPPPSPSTDEPTILLPSPPGNDAGDDIEIEMTEVI